MSAGFYFILMHHPLETVEAFCETTKTGLNLKFQSTRDPVFVLRKEISENWTHGKRQKVPRGYLSAAIVKAFNAWARDKKTNSVRMQDREPFPSVVA